VNPAKRISLGLKQRLRPVEEAEKKYPIGKVVEGPVTNMTNFGAFVDLGAGVRRRSTSAISRGKRLNIPRKSFKRSQSKSPDFGARSKQRRIRLGMKQLSRPPPTITSPNIRSVNLVTGRVVEKGERAKVELGDGVFGNRKLSTGEVPRQGRWECGTRRCGHRDGTARRQVERRRRSGESSITALEKNAVKPDNSTFKIANLIHNKSASNSNSPAK
jgi:ribosomal protein S1